MLIHEDLQAEVPDTNVPNFNLINKDPWQDDPVLCWGYNSGKTNPLPENKSIALNMWMPTEFCQFKDHLNLNPLEHNSLCDTVYGICPYTVEWLKKYHNLDARLTFYPFNVDDIPEEQEKEFDVCYFGGLHSHIHLYLIEVLLKYKYLYFTKTTHINELTRQALKYANRTDLTHREKIKEIGKCKTSVCMHVVPTTQQHREAIKKNKDWESNKAFNNGHLMPQFKSRMLEAAMAKTLNIVWKDPWDVADWYFSPDEYISFSTFPELDAIIKDVSLNYEKYVPMIEKAFDRVMNYTTDNMMSLIEEGKEWKPLSV